MTIFLLTCLGASLVWGLVLWLGWCWHLRHVQTALNLPAGSSAQAVRDRVKADRRVRRGPWR